MKTETVVIPDGATSIAPMVLDTNLYRWVKKKGPVFSKSFHYVGIPHNNRYSPFAS